MKKLWVLAWIMGCIATTGYAIAQSSAAENQASSDKAFLQRSSEGGYAEVQFGQLAEQRANSPDVKAFGQKMVQDHSTLNDRMQPIAERLGVSPASSLNKKNQVEYDKLSSLSGPAFDKEYITAMVEDHRKDLVEFRHEERATSDPELKSAVTAAERVITEHGRIAGQLATQIGVSVPATHRGAPIPTSSSR